MIGAAVFAGIFAVLFLGLGLFVDPRGLWWRFRAPRLADPEAEEPSSASFTARRVILVVLGLFMAWQSYGALRLAGVFDSAPDHEETLRRVKEAAELLETEDGDGLRKLRGLEGSWGEYINPVLTGPEELDPVARLVEDGESGDDRTGDGSEAPGKDSGPEFRGTSVERYQVDGICLTVTATPLPGQSERDHALDLVRYSLRTDVVDDFCPDEP
ncbi:hypothetical protein AB0E83_28760 [Streptomyces sp. NPDC035033]|uniref:hypothetical protein n=1 Tax=Streptomyces sp. NPDC035033 TaxID=3155368 RepID=UPI0033D5009D